MNRDKGHHARPPLITSQIGSLYKKMLREGDRIFREQNFPLEIDQIPVLVLLYYQQGMTQQDISSKLQRDKASVNRTVAFLTKKDLVTVVQDVTDKRKTRVELTATGKELAAQADAIVKKMDKHLIAGLSEKEIAQFSTLINKLIETSFT